MKLRCEKRSQQGYKYYGGRGISVCARWRNSFENFLADMGLRPSKEYTIDRINNMGDYEPANCRWATRKEQAANQRERRRKAKQLSLFAEQVRLKAGASLESNTLF